MPLCEVRNPRDLRRFIDLAGRVHAHNACWIPPPRRDVIRLMTGRSPLSGAVTPYGLLFERDEVPVARAAAFVNRRYIEAQGRKVGFVGLFEARPGDPEAAQAVLAAACDRLAAEGMEAAVGPINGDALYGFAMQIDRFDVLPVFPYAAALPVFSEEWRRAGFVPAYPELAYRIALDRLEPSGLSARSRVDGLRIRPAAMATFRADCETMTRIINAAFQGKWYFAPLDLGESLAFWTENRQAIVPELFLIAERGGRPVGCVVSFPDYAPVLRAMHGGSGPVAVYRFLVHRRTIRQGSLFIVAVDPGSRGAGIGGALVARALLTMQGRGYACCFYHTVTADNLSSRRIAESFGGIVDRNFMGFHRILRAAPHAG